MVLQSPVRIARKCYDEGGTKAPSLEVELGLVIHVHPAARHPMGRIPEAFGRLGHHCESTKIWYPLHSVATNPNLKLTIPQSITAYYMYNNHRKGYIRERISHQPQNPG